jgi:hypothetical protein
MNAEIFAKWLLRQGHQVVQTESCYWFDAGPHCFQAFPYHWVIEPTEMELRKLLLTHNTFALRYSTALDAASGAISYHAVYDQPDYELASLDRRTRQNIRKGLRNCQVEPIPFEQLAEHGYGLELDTACRQGRQPPMTKGEWEQRYLAAGELPGFEAWGALVDGRLVATLLSFQMDDCCELISQQCHGDYLNDRVNNALSFVVTQTMVNRPGIQSIFYSLQSLDAPPSVDTFKFRMGYTPKPVRQRVVFHPWLAHFANHISHEILLRLLKFYPENVRAAKAEGMLRFYLQGKHPLLDQEWPACLETNRAEILANSKS